ncbi:MAG: glycoside hydrolase family 92 protein, partial [Kiritimatiellae bacterium]|nr:glycoside hydrolase family 92 protein [Kiritimatiellia bacterium]
GGEYVLGAPQVPKVVLHLSGAAGTAALHTGGSQLVATADAQERVPPRTFTVIAKNLSKENKYVKSVTLNGKPLGTPILRHADIMRGGELVFEMTGHR